MSTIDIEQKVIEAVAKGLNRKKEEITIKSRLNEDLQADSLSVVELMMQLEADFGVEISDAEASKMYSVECVVQHIEKKHNAKHQHHDKNKDHDDKKHS